MKPLNLLQETLDHFQEGAVSVRAHGNNITYVITKGAADGEFWITREPGYTKEKTTELASFFSDIFGIEAHY